MLLRYFCVSVSAVLLSVPLYADVDPDDSFPTSAGKNFAALYYHHSWSKGWNHNGMATDADLRMNADAVTARLTTYRKLADRLFVFRVGVPYAHFHVKQSSTNMDESASAMGDPYVMAGFWPYENKEQGVYWGINGWLTVPLGEYDNRQVVNIGGNRWEFTPETTLSLALPNEWEGKLIGGVTFFSDNSDYGVNRQTRSRGELYTLQGGLSKQVTNDLNLSLGYVFQYGGESEIDGVKLADTRKEHAMQISGLFPLFDKTSMRLFYRNWFEVEQGPNWQTVGLHLIQPF
ncbi:transporter [Candidatus Magnetaquicoccus inordinatus]|uniref:transporter n=1 Tax=Candidatus Magnetaquicoccus inordinatus TaxID=2496818 RepID=UPI00102B4BBB|nr:transporter [Candidatus Magnetaquicoccus inordinatus]